MLGMYLQRKQNQGETCFTTKISGETTFISNIL
jgi:hypothetical protein